MNVELSDADLAQRIAEGHRDAEAEVCRRMGPRIRLYGLRHLRSGSAADDLVQQVLLKLLEALRAGRVREPDKLPQFVLGTCRMTVDATAKKCARLCQLACCVGNSRRKVSCTSDEGSMA